LILIYFIKKTLKLYFCLLIFPNSVKFYWVFFLDVFVEVKDEEKFWGRGTVPGALMCLSFYLLVELGRQIGKSKRR